MQILVAPNAFKNSLDAFAAAEAIAHGFALSELDCNCECFPVGDGGDGTADLIIKKCKGVQVEGEAHDPSGKKINSSFGIIDNGSTAIIEMANASGLRLLDQEKLNPLLATCYGTGEQVVQALDKGVKKIIIGMGGSATVDGGVGILKALGIRFIGRDGNEILSLPAGLSDLATADLSNLDNRINDCKVFVLCDVQNFLLGENGSTAIFGPQKGASPEAVIILEKALDKLSKVGKEVTGKDMSAIKRGGTSGGAAAGLYAFINATLVNGIDYFLTLTKFDDALKDADLVVTGEGSIDDQTLQGKGPFGVASRAKQFGLPVIGIAGKVPAGKNESLMKYFDVLMSINEEPFDPETALIKTEPNLVATSKKIGDMIAKGEIAFSK